MIFGPGLAETIATETVIAVVEDDGVDKGAAADGTHEVAIVVGHVVQQTHIHRWIQCRRAGLLRKIVGFLHTSSHLETSHTAHAAAVAVGRSVIAVAGQRNRRRDRSTGDS